MSYDNLDQRHDKQVSESVSSASRAASNTAREAYNPTTAGSNAEGAENIASSLPTVSLSDLAMTGQSAAEKNAGGGHYGGSGGEGWGNRRNDRIGSEGAQGSTMGEAGATGAGGEGQAGYQNLPPEVGQLFSSLNTEVVQLQTEVSQLQSELGAEQSGARVGTLPTETLAAGGTPAATSAVDGAITTENSTNTGDGPAAIPASGLDNFEAAQSSLQGSNFVVTNQVINEAAKGDADYIVSALQDSQFKTAEQDYQNDVQSFDYVDPSQNDRNQYMKKLTNDVTQNLENTFNGFSSSSGMSDAGTTTTTDGSTTAVDVTTTGSLPTTVNEGTTTPPVGSSTSGDSTTNTGSVTTAGGDGPTTTGSITTTGGEGTTGASSSTGSDGTTVGSTTIASGDGSISAGGNATSGDGSASPSSLTTSGDGSTSPTSLTTSGDGSTSGSSLNSSSDDSTSYNDTNSNQASAASGSDTAANISTGSPGQGLFINGQLTGLQPEVSSSATNLGTLQSLGIDTSIGWDGTDNAGSTIAVASKNNGYMSVNVANPWNEDGHQGSFTAQIPIPDEGLAALNQQEATANGDGHVTIEDTANGQYYDLWEAQKIAPNGASTGGSAETLVQGSLNGNATPGATAADIAFALAELAPSSGTHMLLFGTPTSWGKPGNPGIVSGSTNSDITSDGGNLQEGDVLQLSPEDAAKIMAANPSLTDAQKQVLLDLEPTTVGGGGGAIVADSGDGAAGFWQVGPGVDMSTFNNTGLLNDLEVLG